MGRPCHYDPKLDSLICEPSDEIILNEDQKHPLKVKIHDASGASDISVTHAVFISADLLNQSLCLNTPEPDIVVSGKWETDRSRYMSLTKPKYFPNRFWIRRAHLVEGVGSIIPGNDNGIIAEKQLCAQGILIPRGLVKTKEPLLADSCYCPTFDIAGRALTFNEWFSLGYYQKRQTENPALQGRDEGLPE